jgi:hypothetical protein
MRWSQRGNVAVLLALAGCVGARSSTGVRSGPGPRRFLEAHAIAPEAAAADRSARDSLEQRLMRDLLRSLDSAPDARRAVASDGEAQAKERFAAFVDSVPVADRIESKDGVSSRLEIDTAEELRNLRLELTSASKDAAERFDLASSALERSELEVALPSLLRARDDFRRAKGAALLLRALEAHTRSSWVADAERIWGAADEVERALGPILSGLVLEVQSIQGRDRGRRIVIRAEWTHAGLATPIGGIPLILRASSGTSAVAASGVTSSDGSWATTATQEGPGELRVWASIDWDALLQDLPSDSKARWIASLPPVTAQLHR